MLGKGCHPEEGSPGSTTSTEDPRGARTRPTGLGVLGTTWGRCTQLRQRGERQTPQSCRPGDTHLDGQGECEAAPRPWLHS